MAKCIHCGKKTYYNYIDTCPSCEKSGLRTKEKMADEIKKYDKEQALKEYAALDINADDYFDKKKKLTGILNSYNNVKYKDI